MLNPRGAPVSEDAKNPTGAEVPPPPDAMQGAAGEASVLKHFEALREAGGAQSNPHGLSEEERNTGFVDAGVLNVYACVAPLWLQLVSVNDKILVVGAGDDISVPALLLQDHSFLTAVDHDEAGLDRLREFLKASPVPMATSERCVKMVAAPTRTLAGALGTDQFEAVLDVERCHPSVEKTPEERAAYLQESSEQLHAVLKPKGMLISLTRPPVLAAEITAETAYGDASKWKTNCMPVEGADGVCVWLSRKL